MNKFSFWNKLQKPILLLAPMEDVTDAAFRYIVAKYGKPDVLVTEFTSCDGLCNEKGFERLKHKLWFSKNERPIVAQLFGNNIDNYKKCVKIIEKFKFDGIDINMGCPDKNICKQGSGAKLIQSPKLAQKIIITLKKHTNLPISVKTRIGYNTNIIESWISALLEVEPAAITIHGRTKKEMSKVPADWESIAKAVYIRNKMNKNTLIIGNGDITSLKQAYEYADKYGVDGVMVGRGIFGNPWFFNTKIDKSDLTKIEILEVMREHAKIYEKMFKGIKNFENMRKHMKAYISGFKNAKNFRQRLLQTSSYEEVNIEVNKYIKSILNE